LREPDLAVHIEYAAEGRSLALTAGSEAGRSLLARLSLDPA
jgi:hypothetical protein